MCRFEAHTQDQAPLQRPMAAQPHTQGLPAELNDLTHLCINYYHLNGMNRAEKMHIRMGSFNDCDSEQRVGAIALPAGSLLEATHGRHIAQHALGRLKSLKCWAHAEVSSWTPSMAGPHLVRFP
jgi:hypothetical protein